MNKYPRVGVPHKLSQGWHLPIYPVVKRMTGVPPEMVINGNDMLDRVSQQRKVEHRLVDKTYQIVAKMAAEEPVVAQGLGRQFHQLGKQPCRANQGFRKARHQGTGERRAAGLEEMKQVQHITVAYAVRNRNDGLGSHRHLIKSGARYPDDQSYAR